MAVILGNDPAILSAVNSLEAAYSAANKRDRAKGTLAGHMGLTGICAGFAIESASRVEKWVRSGKHLTGEGPKIPDHSTSNVQENEKLLLSSVFESIGPKDDWRSIRSDWDPELVLEILQRFVSHLSKATGAALLERIPKREFVEIGFIEDLLERVPETDRWDAHYMIQFSDPKKEVCDWHVAYFHPKSGTITDGANFLHWRGSDLSLSTFKKVLASYVIQRYSLRYKECSLYKFAFPQNPKSLSLFQKYQATFSRTLAIARHQPKLAMRYFVGQSLPGRLGQKMVAFDSIAVSNEFYTNLQEALSAKNYPIFLSLVLKRGHRIPDRSGSAKIVEDPKEVLPLLEALHRIGASSKPVLVWVLEGVFSNLIKQTNEELPQEQHQEFRAVLRSVMELCHKSDNLRVAEKNSEGWFGMPSRRPFVEELLKFGILGDVPEYPQMSRLCLACALGDLELVKLLVKYGANPTAAFYRKGSNPIDVAFGNGHTEVVKYLEAQVFPTE